MVTSPGGGGIVRRVCLKCGKLQLDLTSAEEPVVEEPHLFFGRFLWLAPVQWEADSVAAAEEPVSTRDPDPNYRFGERPTGRRRPQNRVSA